MPGYAGWEWAVLAGCAVLVGVAKTGVPGVGLLGTVLVLGTMGDRMTAKETTGFILPLLIVGDIFAVGYYRRHAVWSHLLRLMPWALVGIVAGWRVLDWIDNAQLKRVVGVIIIVLLAVEYWRGRSSGEMTTRGRWWFAAGIGVLAGFTTMLANAAGPLVIIYFLAMKLEKETFIGTSAWYFLILNCVKVPFFAEQRMITGELLRVNAVLVPAILAGAVGGVLILKRIPQRLFAGAVRVLVLAMALLLLV